MGDGQSSEERKWLAGANLGLPADGVLLLLPFSLWKCTAGTVPWWPALGISCAAGEAPRLTRPSASSAWMTPLHGAMGATWAIAPAWGSSHIPASRGSSATATTCSTSARAPCSSSGAPAAICGVMARAECTTTCSSWARCCLGWRPSWSHAARCCSLMSFSNRRLARTGTEARGGRSTGKGGEMSWLADSPKAKLLPRGFLWPCCSCHWQSSRVGSSWNLGCSGWIYKTKWNEALRQLHRQFRDKSLLWKKRLHSCWLTLVISERQ